MRTAKIQQVAALAMGAILLAGCVGFGKKTPAPPPGKWVGLHLLTPRSDADLDEIAAQLPGLAEMGINVLILEVNYGFEFQSHPELRMGASPITKAGARKFAKTCRDLKIKLIPQFSSLGHQSWAGETFSLLTKYPELDTTPGAYPGNKGKMSNGINFYCREWDPYNPKVYQIVFPLYDEIMDAFEADMLHVGMDEAFLIGDEHSPSTRGKNPAQVYAYAVKRLHNHIVGKRKWTMLMWGDRFIDSGKYKFGAWEGSESGTWPAIDMIPKDIILCPWHYEVRGDKTYPSVPMMVEKGFRVLPATWNKVEAVRDLIVDTQKIKDPDMLGILFTTWSGKRDWANWPPIVNGIKVLNGETLTSEALRPAAQQR